MPDTAKRLTLDDILQIERRGWAQNNLEWMLLIDAARAGVKAAADRAEVGAEDYVLVPRKPTRQMCFEGAKAAWAERNVETATATDVWNAMIEAAPRVGAVVRAAKAGAKKSADTSKV